MFFSLLFNFVHKEGDKAPAADQRQRNLSSHIEAPMKMYLGMQTHRQGDRGLKRWLALGR